MVVNVSFRYLRLIDLARCDDAERNDHSAYYGEEAPPEDIDSHHFVVGFDAESGERLWANIDVTHWEESHGRHGAGQAEPDDLPHDEPLIRVAFEGHHTEEHDHDSKHTQLKHPQPFLYPIHSEDIARVDCSYRRFEEASGLQVVCSEQPMDQQEHNDWDTPPESAFWRE